MKNIGKNSTEHNDANTSDIIVHETIAEDIQYIERLKDWDSKNHQIITWLGLAHYYQLHSTLVSLNKEVGQFANEYLATLQPIWTQLDQEKFSPDHIRLIKKFYLRRKDLALSPLCPLMSPLQLLISDITEPSSLTKNCKLHGHKFANCPTIECRYCHKRGHTLDNCPTHPPRPSGHSHKPKFSHKVGSSSVVVATTSSDITEPSSLQLTDLHDLLKQVIFSQSTALAVTPSTSWLLDSACCNHMTSHISILSSHVLVQSLPPIHSADGDPISISHIVQDSQTGQVIGTGWKVGQLFELTSLQHSLVFSAISAPVTDNTLFQWHLHLDHASSNKLRSLTSTGLLNNVS
ncbi:Copia protein [Cucumis melo var. makuwa]|uniref:Copia protein n=1 Tax=Cucumis melo var. makuwa TaxID=1194695 RepID=A0A5A7UL86_CUCMM|nr:Copia protein [Cucumis melo var. makuwa]